MAKTVEEFLRDNYKMRIPPIVFYDLLADIQDFEFIPKDMYEERLREDMAAMLTEIQLEIEEQMHERFKNDPGCWRGLADATDLIQERIDALRGEEECQK